MQQITLHLSVPRYVKKILQFKYGDDYKAREDTLLGMVVLNTLQKKSERNYTYKRTNSDITYFSLKVGIDKASRKGFQHNQSKAYQISKAIERDIREKLYTEAVTNEINYGIDFKTTIQNFLDLYDIAEDELSYETIRKDFNRWKHQNIKKFK
ncbi:hypothetical protein [Chryseobacterium sp. ZHDP1]|uniref:hypothetical protein n=1 Tax=Chryseobacterium sp. ZHDP1 TaxID=2838877 RepID=UPI001BE02514|nr:hypothetical protein [Chryseobacterium sp. ZHDP1]QWA38858.1 hypothetical protein KKI44_01200 [Chryseobacterium sp. ZHDP1]